MRILISAYACRPNEGSEPGAGWEWTRAVAARHECWLLTHIENAPAISQALEKNPIPRLRVCYVGSARWAYRRHLTRMRYVVWQSLAWWRARELHQDVRFDIAHHLTYGSDWMPAAVLWVRGLPAVWGPVGGTTRPPWVYWRWLGWRGLISEGQREVGTRAMRLLVGLPTARHARILLAQNHEVAERYRKQTQVIVEPCIALTSWTPTEVRRGWPSEARKAVFAGRLLPLKGLHIALEALAEPSAAQWSLDIYGDGPDLSRCQRLVLALGLRNRVRFLGWHERSSVVEALASADALLFPSLHDSAGWTVAEAISVGTPVICLDRGGPAYLVGDRFGARIPDGVDVPQAVAQALLRIKRHEPASPWNAARLGDLIESVYGMALGDAGVVERIPESKSQAQATSQHSRAIRP